MNRDFWESTPVLRALLPYLAGIISAIHFGFEKQSFILLLPVAFCLFILLYFSKKFRHSYRYSYIQGLLLFIIFFSLGILMTYQHSPINKQDHFSKVYSNFTQATVRIYEPAQEKEKSVKLQVKVLSLSDSSRKIPVSGRALCYLEKTDSALALNYNDELIIPANFADIANPSNPDEFNYKRYMSFHGIYQQAYIPSGDWQLGPHHAKKWFYLFTDRLRIRFSNILEKYLGHGNEFKVAAALILGERGLLDKDLIRAYSGAGAMHVLAVSGLHIGLVYGLLWILFSRLPIIKKKEGLKGLLLLSGIWLYASLTGLSASVSRAAIMLTFIIGGNVLNRYTSLFNSIVASAFVLTLYNPYYITEVGFLLSYLAVSGIVLLQPKLYRLLYFRWWIIDKIWALSCVSISAQLATFPVALLFFHQFPLYFLFSNLIVIPVATIILYIGISLFALNWIPWVSYLIGHVLYFFVFVLNQSIDSINSLPSALISGLQISKIETILIFITMLLLGLFIARNQFRMLLGGLLSMFLLFFSISLSRFEQKEQKEFIIYSIPRYTAFQFISGNESYFIADTGLTNNQDKMLFHIKHHWWRKGLKKIKWKTAQSMDSATKDSLSNSITEQGHFFKFSNHCLFVLDDPLPRTVLDYPKKVDCILVSHSPPITMDKLLDFFKPKLIIFDHSNRNYLIDQWIASCNSLKIPYFNAAKTAFVWHVN